MFSKCTACLHGLSWRLRGVTIPKWHTHLQAYCSSRAQKQSWCQMFIDNLDLITDLTLPREVQLQIRNTNIASEIVKIISSHYEHESNLFKFAVELFGSYLKLKYSETINPSKNTLNRMAREYQSFLRLLIDLFVLFYHLEDRQIIGEETFYKSTLPFLASTFAFSNEDISNTVTRVTRVALKVHIDKLAFQSQRFASYSISQYSVREELQLNRNTIRHFKAEGTSKVEDRLYSGAVQIVKQIVRVNSPAEKIKLAEGLQKQIESSISQFYRKHNIQFSKIEISSEDLSSILMYVIVEANQPTIYAHLQIAQLFSYSQKKPASILQVLVNACEYLQSGATCRRQTASTISEMTPIGRKYSDSTSHYFDQVTSNLEL